MSQSQNRYQDAVDEYKLEVVEAKEPKMEKMNIQKAREEVPIRHLNLEDV